MSSLGDVFACFGSDWPGVADGGFEGTDGWLQLGQIPGGAEVEGPFWDAVRLQQTGGGRGKWKRTVDFHADVLVNGPAYARIGGMVTKAEPFWLGLHPFAGSARLFVSTAKVGRAQLARRFQRHPGIRVLPDSTLLGFRLRLGEDGSYFEVARP